MNPGIPDPIIFMVIFKLACRHLNVMVFLVFKFWNSSFLFFFSPILFYTVLLCNLSLSKTNALKYS